MKSVCDVWFVEENGGDQGREGGREGGMVKSWRASERERTDRREEERQTVGGCFSSALDETQEMQTLRALPH